MIVDRIQLDKARVVPMRELNQRTAAVLDEINKRGEPAVVTKHGRFVALITPLEHLGVESLVLSADPQLSTSLRDEWERGEEGRAGGKTLAETEAWLNDADS